MIKPTDAAFATSETALKSAAQWCVDQRQAWQQGCRIPVESYLQQHAALHDDAELLLDLIYNEIVLREEVGDAVSLEEYLRRFPDLGSELERLFAVHRVVVCDSLADSTGSHDASTPPTGTAFTRPKSGAHAAGSEIDADVPIAGYEILQEVGRGGMGIVYRARQPGTNRIVALKVILTGRFASDDELTRFQTEAEAASRLEHPGIVPIYEVGRAGELYYLSMAYVEGETLADMLARGPLPPRRAAEVVRELALAVEAAHEQGVIHRDLKPQNILIDREGRVRITDFGLARQDDRLCSVTSTGQILGTPQYMPPEQAQGRQDLVGPASDLYALGAILYCGLVGRPPFDGAAAVDVLNQVILDEPVAPRVLNPAVPLDLETICLKCLEKEPPRRYASARELAEDLRRYRDNEPIAARPIGALGRLWRWSRRKPLIAGLSSSIVLLTAALIVGSTVSVIRLKEENTRTAENLTRAVSAEGLANQRLLDSLIAQIQSGRQSGRPGQRTTSLSAVRDAASLARKLNSDPDVMLTLRNEAVACLTLTDVHGPDVLDVSDDRLACFDPQSEKYAAWNATERAVVVFERTTKQVAGRWNVDGSEILKLQFSPDGRELAALVSSSTQTQVLLWNTIRPDEPPISLQPESGRIADFDVSTNSDILVLALQEGVLETYDIETGDRLRAYQIGGRITGCRLNHSGTRAAVWTGGQLRLVRLEDGAVSPPVRHEMRGKIESCAWSARDDLLVTGGSDHVAVVWMATDQPSQRCVLEGHESWVKEAAFHPQADVLMTAATMANTTRLWDPWTGTPLLSFQGTARNFSSDGRQLQGSFGKGLATWPLESNHVTRRLLTPEVQWPVTSGQVSDNGELLLTCGWDGFQLWDHARGDMCASEPLIGSLVARLSPGAAFVVASSDDGVQRWPLQHTDSGDWLLGEREMLPLPPDLECVPGLDFSLEGTLAAAGHGQAWVVARDHWPRIGTILRHESADRCALSPDGRWLATFGVEASGVRIWETQSGSLISELCTRQINALARFSPCGRWLLAGSEGGYHFWSPGSWTKHHRAMALDQPPTSVAFSGDGRLLAASDRQRHVQLLDVDSGRLLVSLPVEHHFTSVCFHPDGTQLVCLEERNGGRIWNLTELQSQLAPLGLNWIMTSQHPSHKIQRR